MAGNTFGTRFRITTFGESHGPAIGVVIDGVRPGVPIDTKFIQKELDRRRPGQSNVTTARKESDEVEILSGVFDGKPPVLPSAWSSGIETIGQSRMKGLETCFGRVMRDTPTW